MIRLCSRTIFLSLVLFTVAHASTPASDDPRHQQEPSACLACHRQIDDETSGPAALWDNDIHAELGLGCVSCHGGDPSPELGDDLDGSMDPDKGYLPPPDRLHIPDFCAHCHADASYMKQFNPQARVDQLIEYRTSRHGTRNAQGDPTPAVCTDCHGAHGIRSVSSPDSSVYATNVPGTCSRCHSDADTMAPYGLATDQYAAYRKSVHAAALFDREDTAAPACNDCHGNHGAAPPGVQSITNVCGQCHAREATLFRASFKKEIFELLEVGECTACHDHHRVLHPTPDLFHFGSAPTISQGKVAGTDPFVVELGELQPGEQATATWIVILQPYPADETESAHRVQVSTSEGHVLMLDASVLRAAAPPVSRIRQAEENGLRAQLTIEPLVGLPVENGDALRLSLSIEVAGQNAVSRVLVQDRTAGSAHTVAGSVCLTCHSVGDECDQATERMYTALAAVERELRAAGALLHQAEIAGMEVSQPQFELKSRGIPAAVEARALIHSFDEERLLERTDEGQDIASIVMQAARAALQEIEYRRRGLAVSLVLVLLVLIGLFLKIRQIDRRRARQPGSP